MSKEAAEASIKAFEEAIGNGEETAEKPAGKKTKEEPSAKKAGPEADDEGPDEEVPEADMKGKIESRLDFLAKMYEARKAEQEEEDVSEDDPGKK
jgi:hypothetical protein